MNAAETAQRDYYEVLGLARDAEPKAIKDAFRRLALEFHPDRNKEPGAEQRFKEIAEAYAVLSDPKKRADYDARGFAGVNGVSQQDLFRNINFEDLFGGLNFDFGAGDLFSGLFGRRRQRKGPQRGANIEAGLRVSLERVANGGDEPVRLSHPASCQACHGTGAKAGTAARSCEACQGTGQITQQQRNDEQHLLIQRTMVCQTCRGRGSIIDHPCPVCQGRGQVEQEESLTVTIPRGVEEGMALRIPGKGMPSPQAGGSPGDLFVVVHSRPDSRFERRGADLLRLQPVSVTDAVLGATLEVPTLGGSASVKIPPGTQPGAVLRLKGKGLPEFGRERHGELYLHIVVQIPEKLSREERQLYQQLRALRATGTEQGAARWWQRLWMRVSQRAC